MERLDSQDIEPLYFHFQLFERNFNIKNTTHLALICIDCEQVLYETEKVDYITEKVLRESSERHIELIGEDHETYRFTRQKGTNQCSCKIVSKDEMVFDKNNFHFVSGGNC